MAIHENCQSNAYREVTCERCGRTYICTLADDFYCCFPEGDHACERCMVAGIGVKTMTVMVPTEPVDGA